MYNYREQMKADLYEALDEDFVFVFDGVAAEDLKKDFYEVAQKVSDYYFCEDKVTGNTSGSYFCNSQKSKEAVIENLELLRDAYENFGDMDGLGYDFVNAAWDKMDVTIRCYLLYEVADEVMEEIRDAIEGIEDEEMIQAYTIAERLAA